MPTASTAQILSNNESFEQYTQNLYVRRVVSGEFVHIVLVVPVVLVVLVVLTFMAQMCWSRSMS